MARPLITMYRVGRDKEILEFDASEHNEQSILCFVYGEIDCRCHIHKQILRGRNEDDIIRELVTNYMGALQQTIQDHMRIIVVGVIPPTTRSEYEGVHGSLVESERQYIHGVDKQNLVPFLGTEAERVRYTTKVNALLEELCATHGYIYFNPYAYYTRADGTFTYELSDRWVHLGNNEVFLDAFMKLYARIFTEGL